LIYSLIADSHSGSIICSSCGTVNEERVISQEAEYRVFADDSASQKKVHYTAYNPFMEYSLTESSNLERDDKKFLWEGFKNIEEIIYRLTNGDSTNKPVQERAKELYQKAFYEQVRQKKGEIAMSKTKNQRKKHSKRKQLVVSFVLKALEENGIKKWTLDEISSQLDGIKVSQNSVKTCLSETPKQSSQPEGIKVTQNSVVKNGYRNLF